MIDYDKYYELYNDPEFESNYDALINTCVYYQPITKYWDKHEDMLSTLNEILSNQSGPLTFPEFKELMLSEYITDISEKMQKELKGPLKPLVLSLITGETTKLPQKTSDEWASIPYKCKSVIQKDVFKHYRTGNNYPDEYEKYYKIVGLTLKSEKWKEKFKDFVRIPDENFRIYKKNMVVPGRMMDILADVYGNTETENFWPLLTSVIPVPEIRLLPEYPLLSTVDIFKLEYIMSFILDKKIYESLLREFFSRYVYFSKKEIENWREKISANKKYKIMLEKAEKLKR